MLDRDFASTETMRISQIHCLEAFYTPIETRFDRLTRLAHCALQVPVAGVALQHHDKLWFKSMHGWNVYEFPQTYCISNFVIKERRALIVEDARKDARFRDRELFKKRPNFRFYAGAPLYDTRSEPIGVVAVYDVKPRTLNKHQAQAFRDIVAIIQKELLTTELRDAQMELISKLDAARRLVSIDPLTRVWARETGLDLIKANIAEATGKRQELAVCMVDVDNFKQINDRFGHAAGDAVLKRIATIMVGSLRGEDVLCRYGGDEFIFSILDIDERDLSALLSRICASVSQRPIKVKRGAVSVSISVGASFVSRSLTADAIQLEEILDTADRALYVAKDNGRNCFHVVKQEAKKQKEGARVVNQLLGNPLEKL